VEGQKTVGFIFLAVNLFCHGGKLLPVKRPTVGHRYCQAPRIFQKISSDFRLGLDFGLRQRQGLESFTSILFIYIVATSHNAFSCATWARA
jgi:hypothetical protein